MAYEEVEKRQRLLTALHARIEAETIGQGLQVDSRSLHELATAIGLTGSEAASLFRRLAREGYLDIPWSNALMTDSFGTFMVRDLSDKGLRAINLLPSENPIDGITAALEEYLQRIEDDPDVPEEDKSRKRAVIRRTIDGVRTFALEFGPKLAAELLSKGMGVD